MRNDLTEYVTAAKLIHDENAILPHRRRENKADTTTKLGQRSKSPATLDVSFPELCAVRGGAIVL